jgi:hypothetical protein
MAQKVGEKILARGIFSLALETASISPAWAIA